MPRFAFPRLQQLGLLKDNKAILNDAVWLFILPQFDSIAEGLRHLLGSDLSGPKWLVCHCPECERERSQSDRTEEPGLVHARISALADEVIKTSKLKALKAHKGGRLWPLSTNSTSSLKTSPRRFTT